MYRRKGDKYFKAKLFFLNKSISSIWFTLLETIPGQFHLKDSIKLLSNVSHLTYTFSYPTMFQVLFYTSETNMEKTPTVI